MGSQVNFDLCLLEDQVDANLAVANVHGLNVRIGQQGANNRAPESHLNTSPYFSIGRLFANPSHVGVLRVKVRLESPEPANDSTGSHSTGNALRRCGLHGVCREPSQANGLAIVSNPDISGPNISAIRECRTDASGDKFLTAPLYEFLVDGLRSPIGRGFAIRGNGTAGHCYYRRQLDDTKRTSSHALMLHHDATIVNVGGSVKVRLLSSRDEK